MNVAVHPYNAGSIESYRSRIVLRIPSEIKLFRLRVRKDVVEQIVAIREIDSCAEEDRQNLRVKLKAFLIEDGVSFGKRILPPIQEIPFEENHRPFRESGVGLL
jgi:hypothetical protein